MPQLDENHDGVQVDLAVGETLELSLLENPTTGYHWQFDPTPPPVLEVISDTFEPPDGALGGRRPERWTFRANVAWRRHPLPYVPAVVGDNCSPPVHSPDLGTLLSLQSRYV